MPTGSYVGFSSGESHCVTGRQRWELGEDLVDASEAIICPFYTVSPHSRVFLSLSFVRSSFYMLFSSVVPSICPKCSRASFVLFGFFSSSWENTVQQGDIECASLKQENKHHRGLSYTVTKGNISFPCTERSMQMRRMYIGCLNMSAAVLHKMEWRHYATRLCFYLCVNVNTLVSCLLRFVDTALWPICDQV